MIDIVREIESVQREVGSGRVPAGEGHAVTLRRTYDAPIEDVWDALTNPDRISRWFLPISGDYRVGGRYQLEGNAGGDILECDRPNRFKVNWMYGPDAKGDESELEIRLARAGSDGTTVELRHTAIVPDEMWSEYGPGAVGVGWEQGMLGLALHLGGGSLDTDPVTWQLSPEGRDFATRSSEGWGAASRAAGVDSATVDRNVANTTAFYAPEPVAAE